MNIQRVWALFFSPTGTTERVVTAAAETAAEALHIPVVRCDITPLSMRKAGKQFGAGDLVIAGTPVYAGRVPNVLLNDLKLLAGNGALAVPVVCYGNRNFDDALVELRDILEDGGFHTVAAGAFIGEHSFSNVLAKGRPDADDLCKARDFGNEIGRRVEALECPFAPVAVPGTPKPYRGYYKPRDRQGNFIDIRKVKPLTGESCDDCGLCAAVCPMGSIDSEDVRQVKGICIKCGACIKKCPKQAKYYDDAGYLYHRTELEEGLTFRREPETFFTFDAIK